MPPRAMPKRRDAGPRVAGRGVGVPYGRADGYMVGGPTSPSRYTPQLGAYRSNFASFLAALSPGGGKHHDDDDEASAFASDADSVMPSHFHRPGPAGYAPPSATRSLAKRRRTNSLSSELDSARKETAALTSDVEEQPGGRYAAPDTWWKRTPLWTPSQELVLVRHALRCSAVLQGDTLTIAATIAASLQLEMGDMFSKEDVHDKLRAMAVEYETLRGKQSAGGLRSMNDQEVRRLAFVAHLFHGRPEHADSEELATIAIASNPVGSRATFLSSVRAASTGYSDRALCEGILSKLDDSKASVIGTTYVSASATSSNTNSTPGALSVGIDDEGLSFDHLADSVFSMLPDAPPAAAAGVLGAGSAPAAPVASHLMTRENGVRARTMSTGGLTETVALCSRSRHKQPELWDSPMGGAMSVPSGPSQEVLDSLDSVHADPVGAVLHTLAAEGAFSVRAASADSAAQRAPASAPAPTAAAAAAVEQCASPAARSASSARTARGAAIITVPLTATPSTATAPSISAAAPSTIACSASALSSAPASPRSSTPTAARAELPAALSPPAPARFASVRMLQEGGAQSAGGGVSDSRVLELVAVGMDVQAALARDSDMWKAQFNELMDYTLAQQEENMRLHAMAHADMAKMLEASMKSVKMLHARLEFVENELQAQNKQHTSFVEQATALLASLVQGQPVNARSLQALQEPSLPAVHSAVAGGAQQRAHRLAPRNDAPGASSHDDSGSDADSESVQRPRQKRARLGDDASLAASSLLEQRAHMPSREQLLASTLMSAPTAMAPAGTLFACPSTPMAARSMAAPVGMAPGMLTALSPVTPVTASMFASALMVPPPSSATPSTALIPISGPMMPQSTSHGVLASVPAFTSPAAQAPEALLVAPVGEPEGGRPQRHADAPSHTQPPASAPAFIAAGDGAPPSSVHAPTSVPLTRARPASPLLPPATHEALLSGVPSAMTSTRSTAVTRSSPDAPRAPLLAPTVDTTRIISSPSSRKVLRLVSNSSARSTSGRASATSMMSIAHSTPEPNFGGGLFMSEMQPMPVRGAPPLPVVVPNLSLAGSHDAAPAASAPATSASTASRSSGSAPTSSHDVSATEEDASSRGADTFRSTTPAAMLGLNTSDTTFARSGADACAATRARENTSELAASSTAHASEPAAASTEHEHAAAACNETTESSSAQQQQQQQQPYSLPIVTMPLMSAPAAFGSGNNNVAASVACAAPGQPSLMYYMPANSTSASGAPFVNPLPTSELVGSAAQPAPAPFAHVPAAAMLPPVSGSHASAPLTVLSSTSSVPAASSMSPHPGTSASTGMTARVPSMSTLPLSASSAAAASMAETGLLPQTSGTAHSQALPAPASAALHTMFSPAPRQQLHFYSPPMPGVAISTPVFAAGGVGTPPTAVASVPTLPEASAAASCVPGSSIPALLAGQPGSGGGDVSNSPFSGQQPVAAPAQAGVSYTNLPAGHAHAAPQPQMFAMHPSMSAPQFMQQQPQYLPSSMTSGASMVGAQFATPQQQSQQMLAASPYMAAPMHMPQLFQMATAPGQAGSLPGSQSLVYYTQLVGSSSGNAMYAMQASPQPAAGHWAPFMMQADGAMHGAPMLMYAPNTAGMPIPQMAATAVQPAAAAAAAAPTAYSATAAAQGTQEQAVSQPPLPAAAAPPAATLDAHSAA